MELKPISFQTQVATGKTVKLYSCPKNKSGTIIDLSLKIPEGSKKAYFLVTVSDKDKLQTSTATNMLPHTTSVIETFDEKLSTSKEIPKILIGSNQHLYLTLVSGPATINVRGTGLEEQNPHVEAMGLFTTMSRTGKEVKPSLIYAMEKPLASYAYVDVMVTAKSKQKTIVTLFNTESERFMSFDDVVSNQVLKVPTDTKTMTRHVFKKMLIGPGERLCIYSDKAIDVKVIGVEITSILR